MSVNERLGFDPSLLPITHTLLKGSSICPQSKQLHRVDFFPPGILRTKVLSVALVPDELVAFPHSHEQALFVTVNQRFEVEYFPKHFIHRYNYPWILFGLLASELTIPVKVSRDPLYHQDSFL